MRAVALVVTLAFLPAPVRADAVDVLDPELARICGGTAHHPNCQTSVVLSGGCCLGVVALGGLAVLLVRGGQGKD